MAVTSDYNKEQLALLIGNPTAAQVNQMVLCKIMEAQAQGSKRPCASFWRHAESWIKEQKLMETLELLLDANLIESYSAGTLTVIVNIEHGE